MNRDKTDVVSVILKDNDLLDTFKDALESPMSEEDFSLTKISDTSISLLQKVKCHALGLLKNILKKISLKAQVLAVLAEYHAKHEEKKIRAFLTRKKNDE